MMEDKETRTHCFGHLEDALRQLAAISGMADSAVRFDAAEYEGRMADLYWHINSAWNFRNTLWADIDPNDQAQSDEMGRYPSDLVPLLASG